MSTPSKIIHPQKETLYYSHKRYCSSFQRMPTTSETYVARVLYRSIFRHESEHLNLFTSSPITTEIPPISIADNDINATPPFTILQAATQSANAKRQHKAATQSGNAKRQRKANKTNQRPGLIYFIGGRYGHQRINQLILS